MDISKISFYGLPEMWYGDEVQMTFTLPDSEFSKFHERLPQDHFTASYTPSEGIVDVWYTVRTDGYREPNRLVHLSDDEHSKLVEAMEKRMKMMENCSCADFVVKYN